MMKRQKGITFSQFNVSLKVDIFLTLACLHNMKSSPFRRFLNVRGYIVKEIRVCHPIIFSQFRQEAHLLEEPRVVLLEQRDSSAYTCLSPMRYIQVLQQRKQRFILESCKYRDTGELPLKDQPPHPYQCLEEIDYIGEKSSVMETKGVGVVGTTD